MLHSLNPGLTKDFAGLSRFNPLEITEMLGGTFSKIQILEILIDLFQNEVCFFRTPRFEASKLDRQNHQNHQTSWELSVLTWSLTSRKHSHQFSVLFFLFLFFLGLVFLLFVLVFCFPFLRNPKKSPCCWGHKAISFLQEKQVKHAGIWDDFPPLFWLKISLNQRVHGEEKHLGIDCNPMVFEGEILLLVGDTPMFESNPPLVNLWWFNRLLLKPWPQK